METKKYRCLDCNTRFKQKVATRKDAIEISRTTNRPIIPVICPKCHGQNIEYNN